MVERKQETPMALTSFKDFCFRSFHARKVFLPRNFLEVSFFFFSTFFFFLRTKHMRGKFSLCGSIRASDTRPGSVYFLCVCARPKKKQKDKKTIFIAPHYRRRTP